jgi:hypothetical protein
MALGRAAQAPPPQKPRQVLTARGFWLADGSEPAYKPALTNDEMRNKNADLQNRINEVLVKHPELRDVVDEVALKQGMWVQVGTPFLDRIQANLLERTRAIIERRPDLEHLFNI